MYCYCKKWRFSVMEVSTAYGKGWGWRSSRRWMQCEGNGRKVLTVFITTLPVVITYAHFVVVPYIIITHTVSFFLLFSSIQTIINRLTCVPGFPLHTSRFIHSSHRNNQVLPSSSYTVSRATAWDGLSTLRSWPSQDPVSNYQFISNHHPHF